MHSFSPARQRRSVIWSWEARRAGVARRGTTLTAVGRAAKVGLDGGSRVFSLATGERTTPLRRRYKGLPWAREGFLLQQTKGKIDAISELRCLEDTWRSVVEEIETWSNKPSYFANVTLTCFALLKPMTAVTCLYVKLHQASYMFDQTIDRGRTVHERYKCRLQDWKEERGSLSR